MLTVTGLAVGIALQVLPGHGGPDSVTTELMGPPLPLKALPGLALVTLLGLAGGVSLGPENPIIAINSAIVVAIFARLIPRVPAPARDAPRRRVDGRRAVRHPGGGGAALHRASSRRSRSGGSLWDRLFLPVAAAGAGATTMHLLGAPPFAFDLPAYGAPQPIDFVTGSLLTCAIVLIGLAMLYALPFVYRALHALRYPIVITTVGGLAPRHPGLHRRSRSRCSRA